MLRAIRQNDCDLRNTERSRAHPVAIYVSAFFTVIVLTIPISSFAQEHDVLVVRPPTGEEKFARLVGDVVDLTNEQAIFISKGGTREQKIALTRIAEFELARSPDEALARQRLATGDFESARDLLKKSQAAEKRTWRRNELEALIAQCELGLGELDAAGKRMAVIVKAEPDSRLLGYLPLSWTDGFKTPSQASLSSWANDSSPALKLLAASWMLNGPKRTEATAQLEKISSGVSKRLACLAEAQLWRTKLAAIKPLDAQRWLQRVESFPEDLRAGPSFVAGQAAAKADLPLRAADAHLRIAFIHPLQSSLALEAQFLAAKQLEKAAVNSDAIALLEKIAAQPEGYPHQKDAEESLTQLRGAAK